MNLQGKGEGVKNREEREWGKKKRKRQRDFGL